MRLKAVYNASYILTAQVKIFKEGEVLHSFTQNSSSLAAQIIVRKILKEITIMLLKKKNQRYQFNKNMSIMRRQANLRHGWSTWSPDRLPLSGSSQTVQYRCLWYPDILSCDRAKNTTKPADRYVSHYFDLKIWLLIQYEVHVYDGGVLCSVLVQNFKIGGFNFCWIHVVAYLLRSSCMVL